MERNAGVLCPLFSTPGNQGIGDLGAKTLKFIDCIADAGFKIWQILPIQRSGSTHSPYQTLSSFAGDPIYINIDRLCEMGLLTQSSIVNCNKFKKFVDYDEVRAFKETYFRRAFRAFKKNFSQYQREFHAFEQEAFWLANWSLFALFTKLHDNRPWRQWDSEYRDWFYDPNGVDLTDQQEEIFYIKFLQFIFYKQLDEVITYAHKKGVKIMGDIPFYVDLDSADVWSDRPDFMIDRNGEPEFIAGCPPDYFSEDGQRWGMPTYNFRHMKTNKYRFWRQRMDWMNRCFDMVRIDHFRAFVNYWKIPASCPTAKEGVWVDSPGEEILRYVTQENPTMELVAEDLGDDLGQAIFDLEEEFSIPGIQVQLFEMETKDLRQEKKENVVLYSGTHDNETIMEAYQGYTNNKRISLRRFFKKQGYTCRNFNEMVCQYLLDSKANTVILPIWDICGYKAEARINTPGTLSSKNWTWKLKDFKTFPKDLEKAKHWIQTANR